MEKVLNVKIKGVCPLILHNGQMADPLNRFAKASKAISKKKTKTDEDYEALSKNEFLSSFYMDGERLVVPGINIESLLVAGAKKQRAGGDAKSGIRVEQDPAIEYLGPKTPEALFADDNFRLTVGVRIKQARVMRCRPIFKNWSLTFGIIFEDEILNPEEVALYLTEAGSKVGLGDWRPRYGRFEVISQSVA